MTWLMKRDGPFVLFEGLNGHLVPMHNYDTLSSGLFVIVGKMILHSVLNNCRGECQDCPQQLLHIYSVEIGMLPLNMPR